MKVSSGTRGARLRASEGRDRRFGRRWRRRARHLVCDIADHVFDVEQRCRRARAGGLPATLWLYPDRVKIITAGSRHEALHPRFPTHGTVSYLPGQRAAQLAAVARVRAGRAAITYTQLRERRHLLWRSAHRERRSIPVRFPSIVGPVDLASSA